MKTYTSLEIELIHINTQDVITASTAYCNCSYKCGSNGVDHNDYFNAVDGLCNCTAAVHNPNPYHKPTS